MARKVKSAVLDTRAARKALKARGKPHYVRLHDALHLGYRKGTRKEAAGRWVMRRYLGEERYVIETIGTADDFQEADGTEVLTFDQAQEAAREHAKNVAEKQRRADAGPAVTVGSAVEEYLVGRDARAKLHAGSPKSDARYRLTKHMDSELAAVLLTELTAEELSTWRRSRSGLTAAGVERLSSDLRAALNAAVLKYRARLPAAISVEIKAGLQGGAAVEPEANTREMQILPDADVRATIAATTEVDAEDDWGGDLLRMIVVLAATGARFSQARRMTVADVQAAQGRLMVPVSRKGKGPKASSRIAVRVGTDVIDMLKPAIAGRKGHEPLLLRPQWEQLPQPGKISTWQKSDRRIEWLNAYELRNPWERIRTKAGLSADVVPYAFRHSSIVRGLRQGLPTRLVAALHDTSGAMIEKYYSSFIVDALDELAARAVVPLITEAPVHLKGVAAK